MDNVLLQKTIDSVQLPNKGLLLTRILCVKAPWKFLNEIMPKHDTEYVVVKCYSSASTVPRVFQILTSVTAIHVITTLSVWMDHKLITAGVLWDSMVYTAKFQQAVTKVTCWYEIILGN